MALLQEQGYDEAQILACSRRAPGDLDHVEATAGSSASQEPPVGNPRNATTASQVMAAVEPKRHRAMPLIKPSASSNARTAAAQSTNRQNVPSRRSTSRTGLVLSATNQDIPAGIAPMQQPTSLPPLLTLPLPLPPLRRTTSDSAAESTPTDFGQSRPTGSTPRRSQPCSRKCLPSVPALLRASADRRVEATAQVRAAATHLPH